MPPPFTMSQLKGMAKVMRLPLAEVKASLEAGFRRCPGARWKGLGPHWTKEGGLGPCHECSPSKKSPP